MSNMNSPFLEVNKILGSNDYLVSNSGLFFAIVQSDGNFCVYRGSGPDNNHGRVWCAQSKARPAGPYFAIMQGDGNFCVYSGTGPGDNRGGVWCAQDKARPEGPFFAAMQDDGNFCVYSGTGPGDNRGGVWCTMATDPVVDVEISSIDYDVAAARVLKSSPAELYRQIVHNQTNSPQESSISGSATVSETSGWSDSLAVKVGVSTSFKTGIPFVAEGKVTVSVDVTNTYTWNGSTTRSKTWGFNTPVKVPPHTTIVGLISATLSTIAVPYTLKGTFIMKSGARVPGTAKGVYTGSNSHDLDVTFIQQDPVTGEVHTTTHAIVATSK
jgi:hypothetical protein